MFVTSLLSHCYFILQSNSSIPQRVKNLFWSLKEVDLDTENDR